ncbi:MAG: hypothetical protein E7671_02255 [Ruminococcaceae bacterium]|nr:hypothetical protein [Oscillospiraceae bacterium]
MNNNRNTDGRYPPNRQDGYTYNSNQNRQPYNAQNGDRGRNPQRPAEGRQGPGMRQGYKSGAPGTGMRSPQYYGGEMRRPISWVPLFAALLVLMISIGIFCTVLNSRSRSAGALGNDTDGILTPDTGVETTDIGNNADDKISVAYASPTAATVELGESIDSDYAVLIDLASNTIVAQKDPDATIYPASMTKVMTLIVAYENCKNLDDTFVMTAAITDPLFIANASVAGFSVGESITIRDLLYGAILPSGGDATDALAIYTAGSIEKFAEMMNKKVLEMGLSNTHFTNPSGLHDNDHYSTPHEMAMILQYALKIDECRKILSTYQYTTEKTSYHPDGLLLTSTMFSRMKGDESGVGEVLAGKTGFTNEGLHCLASLTKTHDGKEYVLVTAHATEKYGPIFDCINIYKNLFSK